MSLPFSAQASSAASLAASAAAREGAALAGFEVVKDMILHHADPALRQPSTGARRAGSEGLGASLSRGLTVLHYAVKKKRHMHE